MQADAPIASPAEFRRRLDEAIELTRRLVSDAPDYPVYRNVLRQLETMLQWTGGARAPTEEQRRAIDVGVVAVRELEPDPDPRVQEIADRIHDLTWYFRRWK